MRDQRSKKRDKSEHKKLSPAVIVAIIGLVGTLVAALLASPVLVAWIQKSPTPPSPAPSAGPSISPPSPSSSPAPASTPAFVSVYVYQPEQIARVEFETQPGIQPAGHIDDFIRVARIAFGRPNEMFNVQVVIKNTDNKPVMLDLDARFFNLEDDQGRSAKLVYFCCPAKGELLGAGQERQVQLFFETSGWYGKEVAAHAIFFRVTGLLPVVRAAWKVPTLATAAE